MLDDRKRRRCFHRVISGLEKGGQLRLITLTSSPDAINPIQQDFRRLSMRLRRRGLFTDYLKVCETTDAGADHLHICYRGNYISQAYLSYLWNIIHQSPVVDIRRVKLGYRHRTNVSNYLAKYMSKPYARRYSWSWGWVYKGFVNVWRISLSNLNTIRRYHPHLKLFPIFLRYWRRHLHGFLSPEAFILLMPWTLSRLCLSKPPPAKSPA